MKKILCLALCLLLSGGLACTKTPQEETDGGTEGAAATAEPTEEPTSEPLTDAERIVDSEDKTDAEKELGDIEDYADFANLLSSTVLYGKNANANFSPISLYLALSMAAEAAGGSTQQELLSILGASDIDSLRQTNQAMWTALQIKNDVSELELNNSFWGNEALSLLDSFCEQLKSSYNAEAYSVPLGDPATWARIGSWISEKTRGTLAPEVEFSEDDLMVLINTIYLKSQWETAFDSQNNTTEPFNLADGTSQDVTFMNQSLESATLSTGDNYQRLSMTLQGMGSMLFILPNEGTDVSELFATPQAVETALSGGTTEAYRVNLSLPKFTFENEYELIPILQTLGVASPFGSNADFSNATELEARISSIIQGTFIDVNELGVEASAYTMIGLRSTSIGQELPVINLKFDRPFMFAITAHDGTLLFVGLVQNPAA
ncbi:MAG: serpin family protein [Clostridia bacterium]|nr:serpin family protein [Clostridia bacterium]